jgi:hypothetical protein
MDLLAPVFLRGEARSFDEYCATVRGEQASALAWLADPEAEWSVSSSLREKITDEGALAPFFGDTVIIRRAPRSYRLCFTRRAIFPSSSDISPRK